MFLARKVRMTILFGCMFGLALLHFISSLVILTTTTDRLVTRAIRIGGTEFRAPVLIVQPHRANVSSLLHKNRTADSVLQRYEREASTAAVEEAGAVRADVTTPHDHVPVNGPKSEESFEDHESSDKRHEQEHFQQSRVEDFCERNKLTTIGTRKLGRHILLHRQTNTAFCFAPKVGCTNLKILFFITQGALPSDEIFKSRDNVDQNRLEAAISKLSMAGLTSRKKHLIIKEYYKFVMWRNPIERLFSAYRSKVQRFPLRGLGYDKPHYNWLKMKIFRYKHSKLYREWRYARGHEKVEITFSDFIDYWLHTGGLTSDEHFQPIYNLCQPCRVRYTYYGNFKTFTDDAEVLIKHLGANSSLLRDGYYEEGDSSAHLAPQYYKLLSNQQKRLIITRLALDLSFYYTLFPSERNIHKVIMDTDSDIPNFEY